MFTLNFNKWEEFREYIDRDCAVGAYYWRGQSNPEWLLSSSFERIIRRESGPGIAIAINSMRDMYLAAFQRHASGLRGANPRKLEIDEWWALGRHYGLITPLLDWSEKPYIALYFALADFVTRHGKLKVTNSDPPQIAVFRLSDSIVVSKDHEGEGQIVTTNTGEEIKIVNLQGNGLRKVEVMLDELASLHAQHSIFTWLDSEKFFDLQSFLQSEGKGDLLTKILLSQDAFSHAYYDLDAHGISYRLLFPDLRGAALAANTLYEAVIDPNFPK